ncbi:BlaI/MecI/CopY family transcriptional regulator [Cochleicola gelatinilyticus]|uniref:Transcriptional regulator n=1 Tax=Cochleicola gelatinilyticus TaxID=1763537 RepID=A0A167GX33_9FLAO|nr:BlaI/MecI/CopY family transcriptional regulator [Cochleicola gelatinilyticus]OAB77994.1 transcriptional regulator [Cochleicola gelatinilyticus]
MQKLAKREEQIMQAFWKLEKAFVKEIIDELPEPKPHYNSVSTMVRILEEKGFLAHNSFGKTHQYYPVVLKEQYQKTIVSDVVGKYFENSYSKMISFFAKEENIDEKELQQIINQIKNRKK